MHILECRIKKRWNSEGNKSFYSQKNSFYTLLKVTFPPLCDKELMRKLVDGNTFAE